VNNRILWRPASPKFFKLLQSFAFVLIIGSAVGIYLSGCHVSRETIYPEFIKQKSGLGEITILSDIMVIQALRGDTNKIDVVENKDIGIAELQLCADHLRSKGYEIRNTVLTSIGLLMNPETIYKIVRMRDDINLPEDALPMGYSPFYLDPLMARDSMTQMSLARLYSAVLNSGQREDTQRTFIAAARVLGRRIGAKTFMVLLTGGFNVPITKGVVEGTPAHNQGERAVAMRPRTQLSMLLYIVDSTTGEVIWEDRIFKNEGVVHKDRILDMLKDLLADLP
jgi:hypothetical protein